MSIDLLDSLNSTFHDPALRQVSTLVGESEESTRTAVHAGIPAMLASLLQKTASPTESAALYRSVTSDTVDTGIAGKLAGLLGNRANLGPVLGTGEKLLGTIFGNRTDGVAQAIGQVAGIKPASSMSLLTLAAPMLFGLLKKHVAQGGATGLTSLLLGQRGALERTGLDSRITNALGFGSLSGMLGSLPSETHDRIPESPAYTTEKPASAYATDRPAPAFTSPSTVRAPERRWLPWAIGAGVAALALWFLGSRTGTDRSAQTATTTLEGPQTPVAALPAKVYFDVGQAHVDAKARPTIEAVAAIMKSDGQPVSVTGYTDRTGNADQNLELAKNRAAAVRDELVAAGVAESQVVLAPPTFVTGSGPPDEARRVEIASAPGPTTR